MRTTFIYSASEFREMMKPAKVFPRGKVTHGLRLTGKERWMVANRARAMRKSGMIPNIGGIVMEYFG